MKKSVLHLNYYYFPTTNARSIRWGNFLNYFSAKGLSIDVLTSNPHNHSSESVPQPSEEEIDGINISRVPIGFFHRVLLKTNNTSSTKTADSSLKATNPIKNALSNTARWFWRSFLQYFLIPDRYMDWIPIATFYGVLKFRKKHYDYLISSGMPFSDHVAAYLLKLFFPKTKWIAEYGDPWSFFTYPPQPRFFNWLHSKLERTILKKVDLIVVTTEETRLGFLENFPHLKSHQVATIPQGADHELIDNLGSTSHSGFTLTYTGRFDPIRDPLVFFESLKNLNDNQLNYEFKMVGPLQDFYRNKIEALELGEKAIFLGPRNQLESLKVAKSSDVLVYFGNQSLFQLPSKLWEYIAMNKPILAITQVENDIGGKIITEMGRGLVVKADQKEIVEALVKLKKLWDEDRLNSTFDLRPKPEFDWRKRADAFLYEMNRLLP